MDLKKRYKVIEIPVNEGTVDATAKTICKLTEDITGKYVCIANVHMLVTARSDIQLFNILKNADIVTSDGMPLVWALKKQGCQNAERVAGPDLTLKLCILASEMDLPVYFFGGTEKSVKALMKCLPQKFPKLKIAGIESPPMLPSKPDIVDSVVNRIEASGAKIVFVGLGCPKQEFWMAEYSKHLPATLIGVGAAFDFLAGTTKRAPLWMQKNGLEWFFRLLSEPRRLWKRYLITNSLFIYYLLQESIYQKIKKK